MDQDRCRLEARRREGINVMFASGLSVTGKVVLRALDSQKRRALK